MWIIDTLLVMDDDRLRDDPTRMIVVTDHVEQVALVSLCGPAKDEKGAIDLRSIYRQGVVLGSVGAQPSRVLISIGVKLSERKPDAPLPRNRPRRIDTLLPITLSENRPREEEKAGDREHHRRDVTQGLPVHKARKNRII